MMNNIDVRKAIEKNRVKYWEVANALNINSSTLSRWLQCELSPERKKAVIDAISRVLDNGEV